MISVSERDRRALMAGAAVIIALLLVLRAAPAWKAHLTDARALAEEMAREVARAEQQSRYGAGLRDTLAARNRRYLGLAPLVLGGSAASAAASLTGVLSGAAATANVRLASVSVSSDSAAGRFFSRVTARVQAQSDVKGLTMMLASLESGPPLLRVRELSVSQMEPGAANDRPENLQISFTITGLALRRGGGGK